MFKFHLHLLASSISLKIGLCIKNKIYVDDTVVLNSFYSFSLPYFKYCTSSSMSSADSQHKGTAFCQVKILLPNLNINLEHHSFIPHVLKLKYELTNNFINANNLLILRRGVNSSLLQENVLYFFILLFFVSYMAFGAVSVAYSSNSLQGAHSQLPKIITTWV